jgi:hypothetical protein
MTISKDWHLTCGFVSNNWEMYIIAKVSQVKDNSFHCSDDLTAQSLSSFCVPPPVNELGIDGKLLNYGQKPLEAMIHIICMFSSAGQTVIDAFAGTHTASLAALLLNQNAIAFESDPTQWTSASTILRWRFSEHKSMMSEAQGLTSTEPAAGGVYKHRKVKSSRTQ